MKAPSLFKQNLSKMKSPNLHFPQAVTILQPKQVANDPQLSSPTNLEVRQKLSIPQRLQKTKVEGSDSQQINAANWKLVQSMNSQERTQFVNTLSYEKQGFTATPIKQKQKTAQQASTSWIQESISKTAKKSDQQPSHEQEPLNSETQEKLQKHSHWSQAFSIANFNLDLKTHRIRYHLGTALDTETINISQIIQLVKSDNNQSQIVGVKLCTSFMEQLGSLENDCKGLLWVEGAAVHLKIAVHEMYQMVIVHVLQILGSTSFKSVFLQVLSQLLVMIPYFHQVLTPKHRDSLINLLGGLQKDCHELQEDQKWTANMALLAKHEQPQLNFSECISYVDSILELVLIEQNYPSQLPFATFLECILGQFPSKITDQKCMSFLFLFLRKLTIHQEWQLSQPGVKTSILKTLKLNLPQQFWEASTVNEQSYNRLWAMKTIDQDHFSKFVHDLRHKSLSLEVFHVILLVSLDQYHSSNLQPEEVEHLNQMLKWLLLQLKLERLGSEDLPFLFLDLLCLFQNQSELYSLVDQLTLDQLMRLICCDFEQIRKGKMVSEKRLKRLISTYNFNSFGNDIFTKIILVLGAGQDAGTEALVLNEVIQKYPFLCYYACEGLTYGPAEYYKYQDRNAELKAEAAAMIREVKSLHVENTLYCYLQGAT